MAEEREEYLSRTTGRFRKRRKDGWTRANIDTFLSHLRVTGDITASAAIVGKSGDSAHNLRAIDPAFDAQVIAARAEHEARIESKIALYVETGGKLPPFGEDGMPIEPPLDQFDPHLGMAYLNYLRAKREGHGRRGRPQPRTAGKEEVVQALAKLIGMVRRRWARRAG